MFSGREVARTPRMTMLPLPTPRNVVLPDVDAADCAVRVKDNDSATSRSPRACTRGDPPTVDRDVAARDQVAIETRSDIDARSAED
jgi:hypothetical protein